MKGGDLRVKFEAVSNRWHLGAGLGRPGGVKRVKRCGKPEDQAKRCPAFACHEGLRLSNL
jgi:hypothetical protein